MATEKMKDSATHKKEDELFYTDNPLLQFIGWLTGFGSNKEEEEAAEEAKRGTPASTDENGITTSTVQQLYDDVYNKTPVTPVSDLQTKEEKKLSQIGDTLLNNVVAPYILGPLSVPLWAFSNIFPNASPQHLIKKAIDDKVEEAETESFMNWAKEHPEEAGRYQVGDFYIMPNGKTAIVPNSLTDVKQKYLSVYGMNEDSAKLSFDDYLNLVAVGVKSGLGMPVNGDFDHLPQLAGSMALNQGLGALGPMGRVAAIVLNVVDTLDKETDRRREQFLAQEVSYESAVEITENADGSFDWRLKPEVAAAAGEGSGEGIDGLTDMSNTGATVTSDNQIDVTVSELFRDSQEYTDLMNSLKELFSGGINSDTAKNEVDKDTGKTLEQMISEMVKNAESNFYYRAKSYKEFKTVAPGASEYEIDNSIKVQDVAFLNNARLKDTRIAIYDDSNKKVQVTGEEFFNKVANMSEAERNEYMHTLANKLDDENLNDDIRVNVQAQINALYYASANDNNSFHGKLQKDFWDELADGRSWFTGSRTGDSWWIESPIKQSLAFFGETIHEGWLPGGKEFNPDNVSLEELDMFQSNPAFHGIVSVVDTAESLYLSAKTMQGLEKGLGKALGKVKPKLADSKLGSAASKATGAFRSGFVQGMTKTAPQFASKEAQELSEKILSKVLSKSTEMGISVAADTAFDVTKISAKALYGDYEDFAEALQDFKEELLQDIIIDQVATTGPGTIIKTIQDNPKAAYYVKRDADGNIVEKVSSKVDKEKFDEISKKKNSKDADTVKSVSDYKVEQLRVTKEELSQIANIKSDKWTDSDIVLKVQQHFFDKNSGLSKLAGQAAARGNGTLAKMLYRLSGDINKLAQMRLFDFYKSKADVVNKYQEARQDTFGGKKPTKAEKNYMNAAIRKRRFDRRAEADELENVEKPEKNPEIDKSYEQAKSKLSEERVKQLDDFMEIGREYAAAAFEFAWENGGFTDKTRDKLLEEEADYFPLYQKAETKGTYRAGTSKEKIAVSQAPDPFKTVANEEDVVDLKKYMSPNEALNEHVIKLMKRVAINDRAVAIREAASMPGMKMHVVKDTAEGELNSLRNVENLEEMENDFKQQADDIREDVKKNYLDEDQYNKYVAKTVMRSGALRNGYKIEGLTKQLSEAKKELSEARKALRKARNDVKAAESVLSQLPGRSKQRKNDPGTREKYDAQDKYVDRLKRKAKRAAEDVKAAEQTHKQIGIERDVEIEKFKRNLRKVMERAQKEQKFGLKQNIDDFFEQLGDGKNDDGLLAGALDFENPAGVFQALITKGVMHANQFTSPSIIEKQLLGDAAEKYRSEAQKKIKIKERSHDKRHKFSKNNVNSMVDKAADYVISKATGSSVPNRDSDSTKNAVIKSNDPRTIRYILDGEEYEMVLSGKGADVLVEQFYAPEYKLPATNAGKILRNLGRAGKAVARAERTAITSLNPIRVLPNLLRDNGRAFVSTSGEIISPSPKSRFDEMVNEFQTSDDTKNYIMDGLEAVYDTVDASTFTRTMFSRGTTEKDIARSDKMEIKRKRRHEKLKGLEEGLDRLGEKLHGNPKLGNFVRNVVDFHHDYWSKNALERGSFLQDLAESTTRKRVMERTYASSLQQSAGKGYDQQKAAKIAFEDAYFAGTEATVNFGRRGDWISVIAQFVPYLAQNFSSLKSFQLSFKNDPLGMTRAMEMSLSAYMGLMGVVLCNDESRKHYYRLSDYQRSNNIILPVTNEDIIMIPLDENLAQFFAPYRRILEGLQGQSPEAYYAWMLGLDILDAVSPLDLGGFSEGDKFNLKRGLQRMGSGYIPTALKPLIENKAGEDFYFGNKISIDADYTGDFYDVHNPTNAQLTTAGKDSRTLGALANLIGIPQWQLQNIFEDYTGDIGKYALNVLDKLVNSVWEPEEGRALSGSDDLTGGQNFADSVFLPFTGANSDEAKSAFYDGVKALDEDKHTLQKEIAQIRSDMKTLTGADKQAKVKEIQDKINSYGLKVTEFCDKYLSAYEITGGLPMNLAQRVYHLYDIYDDEGDRSMMDESSAEAYYTDKARQSIKDKAYMLGASSGIGKYMSPNAHDYYQSYGQRALKRGIAGAGDRYVGIIDNLLNPADDYDNAMQNLYYDAQEQFGKAVARGDYDLAKQIAYVYDRKLLDTIAPFILEEGPSEVLNRNAVIDYLTDWILVPSDDELTAKGKYVPKLEEDAQKKRAFVKPFLKKRFGVQGE